VIDVDDHTADLRRAYDRDAARRDAREPEPWRLGIVDDFVARVVPGARTGHVLELGCGTGQVAHRLVRAGLTVTAVDLSPTSTAYAVARGVAAVPTLGFARIELRTLAVPGGAGLHPQVLLLAAV
jgi:SAM-dependent methyltransferase